VQKKFRALRVIGTIMKVLGIIQAVVAFIGMVAIIIIFSMSGSMITAFGFYLDMGSSPVLIGIWFGAGIFPHRAACSSFHLCSR